MKSVLAIAQLAIRAAIRSKLFIFLVGILLVAAVFIPLTLKGDGTLLGQTRVRLYYSLQLAGFILGIVTLWTSCASLAEEIEGHQIQLVAVKPVRRIHVWLGKWIGIVCMNVVLLTLVMVASGLLVLSGLHGGTPSERDLVSRELLQARERLRPAVENVDREARETLDRFIREKRMSADLPRAEALNLIRERIQTQRSVVPAGETRRWVLGEMPGPARSADPVDATLGFRFYGPGFEPAPVSGTWRIGTAGQADLVSLSISNYYGGLYRLPVRLPAELAGQAVTVEFVNGSREVSGSAVFHPREGVELRVSRGTFGGNLVRGALVMLCGLAFLAALGVTAGALFSFPVASFFAIAVIVLGLLTHYTAFIATPAERSRGEKVEKTALARHFENMVDRAAVAADRIIAPTLEFDPPGKITEGLRISWADVGRAFGLMGVLYPSVFGFLSWAVLRRRELALPE